jgi:hypothetical protein
MRRLPPKEIAGSSPASSISIYSLFGDVFSSWLAPPERAAIPAIV